MAEVNRPALVLLSGGLDSTVLLHSVAQKLRQGKLFVLSFNYGQRHNKELDCARYQADLAGATSHEIIDIAFLGKLLQGSTALIPGGPEVPNLTDLSDNDREQPPTYVPNRNMMLLALAAAHAEARGIQDIYYGAQAQDEYGYWDCTIDFLDRINAVLCLNRRTPVTVHAPLIRNSKADNVRLGLELGVDFAHTWSCYRGDATACGLCPTCIERLQGFSAVGAIDPLPYPEGVSR